MVFGKVIKGKSVVRAIEAVNTAGESPVKTIKITDCGELKEGEDDGIPQLMDGDEYEDWPGNISFLILRILIKKIFIYFHI